MPCCQANNSTSGRLRFLGTHKLGQGHLTRCLLFVLGGCLLCTLVYLTHVELLGQRQRLELARKHQPAVSAWRAFNKFPRTKKHFHSRRWPEVRGCLLSGEEENEEGNEEEGEEDEDGSYIEPKDDISPTPKRPTDLLQMKPPVFLENYKNPCWFEQLSSDSPYTGSIYGHRYTLRNKFKSLEKLWRRRLAKGKDTRLRCLPYYYIAGMPKCGTTDLYYKLTMHPDITLGMVKEPHWWTRTRIGIERPAASFDDYVDLFDKGAECIRSNGGNPMSLNGDDSFHGMILGEASASTLWDNRNWRHLDENSQKDKEPKFLTADYVHHLQPNARIIVIMRNPIDRLWSDFLYFRTKNKTAEYFDAKVQRSIELMTNCLQQNTMRSCTSNMTLSAILRVRLTVGMYCVYLSEWLRIFPRNQLYVLRLEDYSIDRLGYLNEITEFLGLDYYPEDVAENISSLPTVNQRRNQDRRQGDMWKSTRLALQSFYEPYNIELARLLSDKRYLWNDS